MGKVALERGKYFYKDSECMQFMSVVCAIISEHTHLDVIITNHRMMHAAEVQKWCCSACTVVQTEVHQFTE